MNDWLRWMQQLQAIAQTGLHYANTPFDAERYERVLTLAAEIGARHSESSEEELRSLYVLEQGYATPRVDVRAACFQNGKILLVQEKIDGRWALPGGWADVGDTPSNSAEREVFEESGYRCRASRLIGAFDANRSCGSLSLYHAYKLVFLCELEGEANGVGESEILARGFFGPDEIPPLSENRTWPAVIEECFAHLLEPGRPTYFD